MPRPRLKGETVLARNLEARCFLLNIDHKNWKQRTGLHKNTYYKMMRGEEPKLDTLFAAAAALQCEAWQLLKPGHFYALD